MVNYYGYTLKEGRVKFLNSLICSARTTNNSGGSLASSVSVIPVNGCQEARPKSSLGSPVRQVSVRTGVTILLVKQVDRSIPCSSVF